MQGKGSIARIIAVFAVCISLIAYNLYGRLTRPMTATLPGGQASAFPETSESRDESSQTEKNDPPAESKPQSSAPSSVAGDSSVAASAPGSAKGKIISKYVSPYTAPSSYNNVYVKNSAGIELDIKGLLTAPLGFKLKKADEPQVLIMHTHTTETYMTEDTDYYTDKYTSRTREKDKNMVSVGEIVAKKLNAAGIKTLHDTTEHDYPQYTGSYTRAAKTINSYLKKYPSIKIVLDLHRDALASGSDKVKLVTEINGKKAAQVMLVMGSQSGSVTNFPNWKENMKLALKLQQTLESKYPTLARPLSLTSKNYNESLTTGSLLIEFGTDANTLEEAHYSAQMVGDALASLFNTLT